MEVEQAKNTYCYTLLYNKSINLHNLDVSTSNKFKDVQRNSIVKLWSPPPDGWLNWNTDASRNESKHSSAIGTICIYHFGRVRYINGKLVASC